MATQVPRYTAAEIRRFPDDGLRYEVIRGELFVTPAPGTPHQRIVVELVTLLKGYLDEHQLGEALVAPFEVELAKDTSVQPDVLVILRDRAPYLTTKRMTGPPSLVIEVISHTSKRTDRLQKRALYLEEGVAEYCVVDPELRRVERWRPGVQEPEVLTETLTWHPGPAERPLEVSLTGLFRSAWRRA
jgi:Uma2 family endonuclease